MTIERNYDIAFVAKLALKEKQIQQNYRPIIAVHKWFARRPGTLFRALALSEFLNEPVTGTFFKPHDFPGKKVMDPFMGGGTPLIEANRIGCDVQGYDINPMSTWIVREEMERLDLQVYDRAAGELLENLRSDLGRFYRTDCPRYGDQDVPVKYFIWVKEVSCEQCGIDVPLFPGYRLATDARHPEHVLICPKCYQLNDVPVPERPGKCEHCDQPLVLDGPAKRGKCKCQSCDHVNVFPGSAEGPPRHRLVAIEYYNAKRKKNHKGRFFKAPDDKDFARFEEIRNIWNQQNPQFVPEQQILPGDETGRLHRWGYKYYHELFNERQLYSLEKSASLVASIENDRIRRALATNFSDLLRYQNMLCRYDTMALKSLDIFSVHGFPVGLMQAESNLLGIVGEDGKNVGSGGWTNIIEKYAKAKRYCEAPFEIKQEGNKKTVIQIAGEWIGEFMNGHRRRNIAIHCASSTDIEIEPGVMDAVFTDPPYFGNVQYGELMDFCYVWLRCVLGKDADGFEKASSRDARELTGNQTECRNIEHFTEGLATVYTKMALALKPGAPLVFTYHHNKLTAYSAIVVAILDAGLTCSASLPCPAEMGGSIHIQGTGSSIVDSVFVCRTVDDIANGNYLDKAPRLSSIITNDLKQLSDAGMVPRMGDVRCITFGHLARLAVGNLRDGWDKSMTTSDKLAIVTDEMRNFGEPEMLAAQAMNGEFSMGKTSERPKSFVHFDHLETENHATTF